MKATIRRALALAAAIRRARIEQATPCPVSPAIRMARVIVRGKGVAS